MKNGPLLEREAVTVIGQLTNLLTTCLEQFKSQSNKYELTPCHSNSAPNGIRGTAVIQGDTLCCLELLVKPMKGSVLVKSAFREDKQWRLQQMQDAVNHLNMARNELAVLSRDDQRCRYSKNFVIDALESVTRSVNMCRTRLSSPCKLSLESLVMSGIVKMFAPPLSGDSIVNFFVLEDSLFVTHYTVQQMHSTLSKSNVALHVPRLFYPTGSILEHAGAQYEVVTAHKAFCVIPWLSHILLVTDLCHQLSCQLREKLLLL